MREKADEKNGCRGKGCKVKVAVGVLSGEEKKRKKRKTSCTHDDAFTFAGPFNRGQKVTRLKRGDEERRIKY